MILEVDMGNTRLKWRIRNEKKVVQEGVIFINEPLNLLASVIEHKGLISKILVVSVVDESLEKNFSVWCKKELAIDPEFVRTSAQSGKVRNGYQNYSALGADRWLAMLAAYDLVQENCVVVSCGTAITLDLIKADGVHLGGYIAPGLSLMLSALTQNTRRIKLENDNLIARVAPGQTTTDAVHSAVLVMAIGLIEQGVHQLQQCGERTSIELIMTGGDAVKLLPFFPKAKHIPDLILNGLSCALPDSK
jgi:type III pantothenate kinase